MKRRTKRVLVIAAVLLAAFLGVVGWAASKFVAWVHDLPNRIVIDGDLIANSFSQGVTESYHVSLRDGDTAIQRQVLVEQFAPLVRENADGAAWIRNEFGDDITALVNSDDPAVSVAASNLLSMFDAKDQNPNGR